MTDRTIAATAQESAERSVRDDDEAFCQIAQDWALIDHLTDEEAFEGWRGP